MQLCAGAAAVLLVVPMVGCGSAHRDDAPDMTGHGGSHSQPAEADETSRDDLRQERVIEWNRFEIVGDRSVRVFFVAGTPDCYGHRVVIAESTTEIEIAVVEGVIPGAPDVCTLEGVQTSVVSDVTEPVGDRSVVLLSRVELR